MSEERKWINPNEGEGSKITYIRSSDLKGKENTIVAEGVLIERLQNKFHSSKFDFMIEDESESKTCVNSAGDLNYQMRNVNPGDVVQIKYIGMEKIKSGNFKGKDCHKFDIRVLEQS